MKVKELIAKLQTFNPEANIWVVCDHSHYRIPCFTPAEESTVMWCDRIQPGDYVDYVDIDG